MYQLYRDFNLVKKGPKNSGIGNPPPFSGNARKKTCFSLWGLPLFQFGFNGSLFFITLPNFYSGKIFAMNNCFNLHFFAQYWKHCQAAILEWLIDCKLDQFCLFSVKPIKDTWQLQSTFILYGQVLNTPTLLIFWGLLVLDKGLTGCWFPLLLHLSGLDRRVLYLHQHCPNKSQTTFLAVQNSSIGDLVTDSLTDWLTNTTFTFDIQRATLETSDLRHLIRVMKRHDLT